MDLDNFTIKYESSPIIDMGDSCTYSMGKNPSGRLRCCLCTEISTLMDIETGAMSQKIYHGSMAGKEIEVVEVPSISYKTADLSRKTYLSLDKVHREAGQYFLRRYICMFRCSGRVYTLRERLNEKLSKSFPLPLALTQLAEIYLKKGLPEGFYHGEPTVNSIYVKRVSQPLKHSIRLEGNNNVEYKSQDVIQLDYGVSSSGIGVGTLRSEVILENEKYLYIRPDSEYESFIHEYPRNQLVGFHFFANSILSLYNEEERKVYEDILTGPIKGRSLKEAFLEMKGKKMRKDALSAIIKLSVENHLE